MHIALCSPAWPLHKHQNGIVTYVHWMKLELERLGHRVSVFTGTLDPADAGDTVHRVARGYWAHTLRRIARPLLPAHSVVFDWGQVIAGAILAQHRRHPIDIIEMEESFGWSADVARITSIPVLVKLHGPAFLSLVEEDLATPFGQASIEREGWALAQAAAIASPSAITLRQTVERYGLAPPIAQHVVNALTVDPATPRWSLATCDRDTVLFVGRFDKRKGGDLILQAFASLAQARPALRLVFVGPDVGLTQPDGSRMHFAQFLEATVPAALRGRVDYRGRLPQGEIAALRTQAMMTVAASRWENQSFATLEAMLQGCPVVCSDAGGCPEIVAHGKTGLLARSGDAADFAVQIAALLDDPEAAAAMGSAALAYASECHAASTVAAQSLALYQRVIDHRPATRA
jgi:glycosyltransferase involved in cell wall biosynthesis